MNKKLIVVDLDGTTLQNFTTIHPKSKEVLQKAKKAGHIVAIATGRPYRATSHIYDELELDTILANYNGGYIHHPLDEEIQEAIASVDLKYVHEIVGKVQPFIENAFAEHRDNIYLQKDTENKLIVNALHMDHGDLLVGDLEKNVVESPNSLVLVIKPENKDQIFSILDQYKDALVYRQWENDYQNFVEIYDINTHKALAIKHMCELYNIDVKDVIAIGDGTNDLEMLQYAGLGVAMKNAHPDLKAVADVVMDYTNEEGGVGLFLEDYLGL